MAAFASPLIVALVMALTSTSGVYSFCPADDAACSGRSLLQQQGKTILQQPATLAEITAPVADLYDPTRFIKTPRNGETQNPVPSCCPAPPSQQSTAGRRLSQSQLTSNVGCGTGTYLKGDSTHGHWGYWYDGITPAMVISSGTNITVEMPTFGSNVAWEHMGEGDPGIEDLYGWTEDGPNVAFKGPNGTTNSHFMNGPIYVCGAEPGDVIQVDILDLQPRPNPGKNNESWGFTGNYAIGWWAKTGYATPGFNTSNEAQAAVYKAIKDNSTGRALWWEPEYTYNTADPRITATLPCVPESAEMLYTTDAGAAMYNNTDYPKFGGVEVPCIDGNQTWVAPMGYGGQIFIVPEEVRSYDIKGKYRLPINMHIGNMGLAPALGAATSTAPPYRTGGNLDNKRIGIGATMYYPVEVAGGLLSMGDCHGHQGDGESAATGIETSMDGQFRITLHKADSLPKKLQLLDYPMLENVNEYIIHGFAYRDWAREIPQPNNNVAAYGPVGGVDLNRAMSVVYNETRDFLINMYDITESDAINVMSHVDFDITQVVDSNVGIHARIPKWFFDPIMWQTMPYYQALVKDGTSRTSYP